MQKNTGVFIGLCVVLMVVGCESKKKDPKDTLGPGIVIGKPIDPNDVKNQGLQDAARWLANHFFNPGTSRGGQMYITFFDPQAIRAVVFEKSAPQPLPDLWRSEKPITVIPLFVRDRSGAFQAEVVNEVMGFFMLANDEPQENIEDYMIPRSMLPKDMRDIASEHHAVAISRVPGSSGFSSFLDLMEPQYKPSGEQHLFLLKRAHLSAVGDAEIWEWEE